MNLKYHPYVQQVRKDIAKLYWRMRHDGKKELATIIFLQQKQSVIILVDLMTHGKSELRA